MIAGGLKRADFRGTLKRGPASIGFVGTSKMIGGMILEVIPSVAYPQ